MFSTSNIVKLQQVKGLGKAKISKLQEITSFEPQSNADLLDILIEHSKELRLGEISKSDIFLAFEKGDQLIEKSLENNIKILSINDSNYPELLKRTKAAPLLLSVKGSNLSALNMPSVAVIGTREVSKYGFQIGERIAYLLAENNINVISGLAKGCDTSAHIGCLRGKGTTLGILAHGLDYIYPKENTKLAEMILEQDGLLVSEYFIGTRGLPNYFVERDRIQAGMSNATIVIETDIKGGTMHTVNFTLDYDRILAAYNHPEDKQFEKTRGNQMLIAQGKAIPLQTKEEIFNLFYKVNPELLKRKENETSLQISEVFVPKLFSSEVYDSLVAPKAPKVKRKAGTKKKPPESPKFFYND